MSICCIIQLRHIGFICVVFCGEGDVRPIVNARSPPVQAPHNNGRHSCGDQGKDDHTHDDTHTDTHHWSGWRLNNIVRSFCNQKAMLAAEARS